MLRCALCGRRLESTAAWKGRGERYYCNGFCAEAEQAEWPAPARSEAPLTTASVLE
jgi:hypothetical protein